MSDDLAESVRRALRLAPSSDRALALLADVPPSTLSRIRKGKRGATTDVAMRLADALGRWADDCRQAETILRRSLEEEEER